MASTAVWFQLNISHSYYEQGGCPGLRVQVTPESEQLLRNHRCLWKEDLGKLTVYTTLNAAGTGPKIAFPKDGLTLTVNLWRETRHFEAFTALPAYNRQAEMLIAEGSTDAPLTLHPTPRTGLGARPGFFAQLHIHIGTTPKDQWPQIATLPLEAAATTWQYYIVGEAHLSQLEIKDKTATLSFESVGTTESDPDSLAAKLQAHYPEASHILYRSTTPVAWRESRYAGIQMLRDGHLIIDNLRNPSWETQGVEIINALPNH